MENGRSNFRARAEAKAQQTLAERKIKESAPTGSTLKQISEEEKKVLVAYRKWKEAKLSEEGEGGDAAPADGAAEGATAVEESRVDRLKRKIERRRRVESLKAKLAEKRQASTPDNIKIQADALKERVARVRESLKKLAEEGEIAPAPLAPPAGAATTPPMDGMGLDGLQQPAVQLPPEITAEIQNIATAAQSLAQMAGVAPANPPDVNAEIPADIPAETPGAAGSGMLPESKDARIARIRALLEAKKAEKSGKCKCGSKMVNGKCPTCEKKKASKKEESFMGTDNAAPAIGEAGAENQDKELDYVGGRADTAPICEADQMIDQARARATARREALKKIRASAMQEGSYDAENAATGDVQNFVKTALDTAGAVGGNAGYDVGDKGKVIQQAGVKHDGPSASMPGDGGATSSIKAGKTWTPRALNYGGKMPDRLPKNLPESAPAGGEKLEEDWSEAHIDHFLERKELNFKDMLQKGLLG